MGYLFYRLNRYDENRREKKRLGLRGGAEWVIQLSTHIPYIAFFCWRFSAVFFKANFKTAFLCLFLGIGIVDSIWVDRKYNEKKIVALQKKYRNDWRNKVISWWLLLIITFLFHLAIAFLLNILIFGCLQQALRNFNLLT